MDPKGQRSQSRRNIFLRDFFMGFLFDRVNDLCAAAFGFAAVLAFATVRVFALVHSCAAALKRGGALVRVSLCGETVMKKYFRG